MAEVAGLVVGVIPFAFDLFDNAVRLFKFLGTVVDMPQDCENLRLQLLIEYNRVLAWGKAAGLIEVPEGSSLGATLGTNATELCAIIARIGWLLGEFRELNARYGNELNPYTKDDKETAETKATDVDLAKKVSNLAISYEKERKDRKYLKGTNHVIGFFSKAVHNTKEVATHPARVLWASVDKEAFEGLLKDLHVLTERLRELMGDHRGKAIDEITAKTYREMVLARNEIQELRDMLDAVTGLIETSTTAQGGPRQSHRTNETLRDLLKLKEICQASEDILAKTADFKTLDVEKSLAGLISVPRYTAPAIDNELVWNVEGEGDDEVDPESLARPRAVLTTKRGDIPVWIEWKNLGQVVPGSAQDKESRLRTVALAEMLHKEKPAALCLPTAVGYFDDLTVYGARRHAWIFEMPDGSDYSTTVGSLYDMLGASNSRKPTLARRITLAAKLASTVLHLHTVNWLHKGIRSDNVVFHVDGHEDNDSEGALEAVEGAVLSGFDYARPQGANTTAREVEDHWDAYRWPAIQHGGISSGHHARFRKTYDIYSLGLVLLEIAHWQPLHKLLGLKSWPDVPLAESRKIRELLLTSKVGGPVAELRDVAGERYWRAVTRCLEAHGDKGLGVAEDADQSGNPEVGIKLQEAFARLVVEELRAVDV